ncbi:MAG TPA: imidazole glycerol phosphate synthase cyclase subunit [Blastocatellia bacterium]|nr:imidazole glycerol phosphate synthase cyclase subunit [Blastocatellia bacterium]
MLKKRLIPVLLLKNTVLVRSEEFRTHQVIGNPVNEVKRFNEWNVDELVYLDITRDQGYHTARDDHKVKALQDPMSVIEAVAKTCFMPLTWGGGVRSVERMRELINHGADKISINSEAFRNPSLITAGAKAFGCQAVIVSIDAFRHPDGRLEVFIDGGRTATGRAPADWAKQAQECGAGEILLQSINRDGMGTGYDLDLVHDVSSATTIPVIACGGVGRFEDYAEGVKSGASAVAAANIWHFKELSDRAGRRALQKAGIDVRA